MVAQAAATAAVQLHGQFTLGVGTGEALNEHIFGDSWPSEAVRLEMLEEAIEVIRELWQGEFTYHYGKHYTVENARIYTRPSEPPKIFISAFGDKSFELATRVGDGFITTQPDAEHVRQWKAQADNKPAQAGYKVCVADSEDDGVKIAHQLWANAGLPGELAQVLPSPKHFEQASELVTEEMTRESTVCGKDVDRHVKAFTPFTDAGFDDVYIANMGPHYADLIAAYGSDVLPQLRGSR